MLHWELHPNQSAAPCIRATKRTFARVGYPKRLISDNYKTFRSEKLRKFATTQAIDWKYILELSPHWGGFSERLNKLIKGALRKTLWKAKLSYEEVKTILIEIEGCLNSRPLCYVYDNDLSEPSARVKHIQYLLSNIWEVKEQSSSTRAKNIQYLLSHIWK